MATRLVDRAGNQAPRSHRAALAPGETLDAFLAREELFDIDANGVARLPVLIGGALLIPELPTAEAIEQAISSGQRSVDIGETHLVITEAEIDWMVSVAHDAAKVVFGA